MIVMLWLLAAYAAGWQRVRTTVQGRPVCAACTYDLRGVSVEAVCPECGGAERKHIFGSAWWYSPRVSCGFLVFECLMLGFPFLAPAIWLLGSRLRWFRPLGSMMSQSLDGATVSWQWWVDVIMAETVLVVIAGIIVMFLRRVTMVAFLWRLLASLVMTSLIVSSRSTWSVERQYVAMVLAVPVALLWSKQSLREEGIFFTKA